ncbi:MAG: putative endonuclease [Eubacteriaceae bacterium]|jgi:putative endonuclease|nr:putative endonuclease [Eubacteriaceae bacterium]MDK2935668.1 putative endonuclease [Eubacteriaceae bacterium]MDN5307993.1 putative endonuclease [Eubacteriaceae bacterium]
MKTYNRKKGNQGELIAEVFLKNQGYRIRDKNYFKKSGEIDLIVEKGQYIIFVEVKFRNNLDYGYPREAVTVSKQKKILKTALWYIKEKRLDQFGFRFDVIEIYFENGQQRINHLENAFSY